MRRADDHTMATLDDVVALATELRSLFPLAVSVADEVQIFRGGRDGIAVSSSNISDPTAEAPGKPTQRTYNQSASVR